MPEDVYLPNGKPTLRRGLLTRLTFEILDEAGVPLKAADAIRQVRARLDLTPHERSLNKSGNERWETYVRWVSSWAKAIKWIDKGKGSWSLTPQGQAALQQFEGDELDRQVNQQYIQYYKQKKGEESESAQTSLLEQALDVIAPGSWTSYGDLARLTGLANQGVGTAMRASRHDSAHRVLQSDGTISPLFEWYVPRAESARQVLEAEGLEFDDDGHADIASRIAVDDLRELMGIDPPPARAWLVRGSVSGASLVPTWLSDGFCSMPAGQARQLTAGMDRAAITAVVEQAYGDKSYSAQADKVTEFDYFLNRMQPDDIVVTVSDGDYYLGYVTGDPVLDAQADDRSNLRRSVDWANPDAPIDYADIPKALAARLSQQRTVVDLTNERRSLESLLPSNPEEPVSEPVQSTLQGLRPATAELAGDNHVGQEWLQEVIDLLWDRRQIIFYGPPGTGKTYLARKIAQHLTDAQNVKLVQFHPSYSYEDFFEGYRPGTPTEDGRVSFRLTPGPFRRLVDVAREDASTPYVLIIDEINRANLAKVFGELYFLLEYRDETVDLLYASGDETGFSLPDNVFIIGTMNTADRSIALVDAAMRRRFAFLHLHPSEPPTSGILRSWLRSEGRSESIADLHDALNARIDDSDFKIGPSYFMRPEVHRDEAGLERMWRTAILPLLEEHHYGEGLDVTARYGLNAIRKRLSTATDPSVDGLAGVNGDGPSVP